MKSISCFIYPPPPRLCLIKSCACKYLWTGGCWRTGINRNSCSHHFHLGLLPFHSVPSTPCSLPSHCKAYLCLLLLSIKRVLPYCAPHEKMFSILNKYIAAISHASRQRQVAGEFSSARPGDGRRKRAEGRRRWRRGQRPLRSPPRAGSRGRAGAGLVLPPPRPGAPPLPPGAGSGPALSYQTRASEAATRGQRAAARPQPRA